MQTGISGPRGKGMKRSTLGIIKSCEAKDRFGGMAAGRVVLDPVGLSIAFLVSNCKNDQNN